MHLIISLVILGLIIMVAMFLAQIALTLVMGIVMLPFVAVSALVKRFRS